MTTLNSKEAPGLLGGAAGASVNEDGSNERSPHASIVARIVVGGNPELNDPVVAAIRILARRGRQLREVEQAAVAAHSSAEAQTAGDAEHTYSTASVSDIRTGRDKSEVSHG